MQTVVSGSTGEPGGSASGTRLFSGSQRLACEKGTCIKILSHVQIWQVWDGCLDEHQGIQTAAPGETPLVSGS